MSRNDGGVSFQKAMEQYPRQKPPQKHLAFVSTDAMYFDEQIEIVEMAAGLLRAITEDESLWEDLVDCDILEVWSKFDDSQERLIVLEGVLRILKRGIR